jgi:hypothetical protein
MAKKGLVRALVTIDAYRSGAGEVTAPWFYQSQRSLG